MNPKRGFSSSGIFSMEEFAARGFSQRGSVRLSAAFFLSRAQNSRSIDKRLL